MTHYVFGLDIGIASVGWAVLSEQRIIDLGVRCFDKAETAKEGEVPAFPSPEELWTRTFAKANAWRDRFAAVPYEDKGGSHGAR